MVRAWLMAGVMDQGRLAPTQEGAPQGGVFSPLLLNIALHGMETAAGVRYFTLMRLAEVGSGDLCVMPSQAVVETLARD
jgi:retron-type reverse transcriptase